MGRFVVTVDPVTGLKDIEKIPILEELEAEAETEDLDAQLDARLDADLQTEAGDHGGDEDPPADEAANATMAGLYEQNVGWARDRIAKIQTQAGVAAVREMERRHPEYKTKDPPGRKGVLNALQERSGEITEGQATSDGLARGSKGPGDIEAPPPAERGSGLPCDECEFTAGSEAGLEAHMETHHPDVAL